MSGTVIRVIEDTHYDFGGLAAGGSVFEIPAQRVDVSQYRDAGLLVRIIKFNLTDPTNDDVQITVVNDPWDPFTGATLFFPPSNTAAPVVASSLNPGGVDGPPTDPYSMWFPLLSPFGALLQIGLTGTRGSNGTPGNALDLQLNADLILKD